jgi:DNA-binding transcriptional LysR family regulator
MNLRQLEVFYAIMSAGSVTGAARLLKISQPAVSAVLKHTEQQLKLKLFERSAGRIQPTPEAAKLFSDASDIFLRLETLQRSIRHLRDGHSGQLVILGSQTLVNLFLPAAIGRFRRTSPEVHVFLQSLPTPVAIDRVAQRQADLGLVYGPINDPGVQAESFFATEIACVVPPGHPLSARRHVSAHDLCGQPLISYGPRTPIGASVAEAFRKAGVEPPAVAIQPGSSFNACLMVSAGAGIALVDRRVAMPQKFDELVFKRFRPQIRIQTYLIFPRDQPRSIATQQFLHQLKQVVEGAH